MNFSKKKLSGLIFAVIAAALAYLFEGKILPEKTTPSSKTTTQQVEKGEVLAKVKKVSDGDTLIVQLPNGDDAKLRLLWIDTPEKFNGNKLVKDAEKCHTSKRKMREMGQKASAYAHRNFHVGDKVKLKIEGKGHYGRYLALIWNKKGEFYNEEIIKDGYACIYKKAKYPKYLENLLAEAKSKGKGLWKDYYKIMECLCE